MSKEFLQEEEYRKLGPYHRKVLDQVVFHPVRTRYNLALSALDGKPNGSLHLDFGGGDGALATMVANRGGKVVVFDKDFLALSYAGVDKRLGRVQGRTHLPFASNSFDSVFMLETLEHIPDCEEMDALREAQRVLKPDGSFIISVPSSNTPVSEKHYRHYSVAQLYIKLWQAGFDIVREVFYRDPLAQFAGKPFGKLIRGLAYGADWAASKMNGHTPFVETRENKAAGIVILAKKTA